MKSVAAALLLAFLTACVTVSENGGRFVSKSEQGARALVDLGMGYLRKGQLPSAREAFLRALRMEGRYAPAYNALGLVFQLEQEPRLAEEHFRRAIASDPEYFPARNNYGAFLYAEERYEEAVQQLEQTVANPYYRLRPQAYENLGVSYLRLERFAEARLALEGALAINPRQPRALLELAGMELNAGAYSKAKDYLHRHQQVAGASARGLWLLVRTATLLGEDSREAGEMLKKLFPDSPEYQKYQESLQ